MKTTTLIILTIVILCISIYFDNINFINETKSWFQSSGSLLVLLGIIFESKYILRSSEENENVFTGSVTIQSEEEADTSTKKKITIHAGYFVVLLGTIIWGYGDLAEILFT